MSDSRAFDSGRAGLLSLLDFCRGEEAAHGGLRSTLGGACATRCLEAVRRSLTLASASDVGVRKLQHLGGVADTKNDRPVEHEALDHVLGAAHGAVFVQHLLLTLLEHRDILLLVHLVLQVAADGLVVLLLGLSLGLLPRRLVVASQLTRPELVDPRGHFGSFPSASVTDGATLAATELNVGWRALVAAGERVTQHDVEVVERVLQPEPCALADDLEVREGGHALLGLDDQAALELGVARAANQLHCHCGLGVVDRQVLAHVEELDHRLLLEGSSGRHVLGCVGLDHQVVGSTTLRNEWCRVRSQCWFHTAELEGELPCGLGDPQVCEDGDPPGGLRGFGPKQLGTCQPVERDVDSDRLRNGVATHVKDCDLDRGGRRQTGDEGSCRKLGDVQGGGRASLDMELL
mmetsp:Transcript_29136/g.67577  ORF Transcript_29136/g.67577 Transcript_29136/m.67577 type:complete len:405 (+) Transcript_29136:1824-3038(+)